LQKKTALYSTQPELHCEEREKGGRTFLKSVIFPLFFRRTQASYGYW